MVAAPAENGIVRDCLHQTFYIYVRVVQNNHYVLDSVVPVVVLVVILLSKSKIRLNLAEEVANVFSALKGNFILEV